VSINLETRRYRLDKLQESDYENIKSLYVSEEVRKYLGGTINEEEVFRAKFNEMLEELTKDSFHWVVTNKNSGEFLGLITLDRYYDDINMEVSYQFLPEWWGNGYATEVIREIIQYAFNRLDLPKVVAETQIVNRLSCNLLERVGMKLEKTTQRYGAKQAIYSIENI
jgi:ribosomal-protein-alanine N-acetyltransferase